MAQHPAEGRREAVCAWLTANGINPRDVPTDADMSIEDGPDGRVLRCEVFDLTPDGHRQTDELGENAAVLVVTVPLKVQPPEWWQPYRKPTRDDLMAVADRLRKLIDAGSPSSMDGWEWEDGWDSAMEAVKQLLPPKDGA